MNLPGFSVEDKVLVAHPELTQEQYADACRFLANMDQLGREQLPWWIGDLINIGTDRWGDEAYQMLCFTRLGTATLASKSRVARGVGRAARLCSRSWEFARLAMKYKKQEDIAEALRAAEEEGLTKTEFANKLKGRANYRATKIEVTHGRTKKFDRLMAEFDGAFDKNGKEWLTAPSNRELARNIYRFALESAGL